MTAGRIAIGEVEAAINRARGALPAAGPEAAMTLEVATLAALYGRLIWERAEGVEIATLTDGERVALRLWLPAPSGSPELGKGAPR
jgi:hypothetical protein